MGLNHQPWMYKIPALTYCANSPNNHTCCSNRLSYKPLTYFILFIHNRQTILSLELLETLRYLFALWKNRLAVRAWRKPPVCEPVRPFLALGWIVFVTSLYHFHIKRLFTLNTFKERLVSHFRFAKVRTFPDIHKFYGKKIIKNISSILILFNKKYLHISEILLYYSIYMKTLKNIFSYPCIF